MPIYAYKCSACGYEQDVLQKMSDPRLTVCPHCGQSTYVKQVTAAGFQLKGSGWYVTDFRGNGSKSDTGHTHSINGHGSSSSGAHDGASAPGNGSSSPNGSAANGSSSTSHTENKTAAPKTAAAPPASSSSAAAAPKH